MIQSQCWTVATCSAIRRHYALGTSANSTFTGTSKYYAY